MGWPAIVAAAGQPAAGDVSGAPGATSSYAGAPPQKALGRFRRGPLTWWPALAAGLGALVLYVRTLAPGLTWAHDGADGGELLAAALVHGVPHPPGYPTYQLFLRGAIALWPVNPARAGNWFSALCAALAAVVLADLARRLAERTSAFPAAPARARAAAWSALIGASAWATAPVIWGQAVITEVHTLNALAIALLLWLLWRGREEAEGGRAAWPWLASAALAGGLGLGNHLSLTLSVPGVLVWLWSCRRLAGFRARPVWWALPALVLGLSVYLYLPLAAEGRPAINWGNPSTPAGFWWMITAEPYRALVFGLPWAYLPGRVASAAFDCLRQFWLWGTLLAIIGLWRCDTADHAWWRVSALIGIAFSIFAVGYNTPDSYLYLIPVWTVAAIWLAVGLNWLIGLASRRSRGLAALVAGLALLALPASSVVAHYGTVDLSQDREATELVDDILTEAPAGSVLLAASDRPTFALWYALDGLGRRPDVALVNVNLYDFPWYREILAGRRPRLGDPAGLSLTEWMSGPAIRDLLYRVEALPESVPGAGSPQEPGTLIRVELP